MQFYLSSCGDDDNECYLLYRPPRNVRVKAILNGDAGNRLEFKFDIMSAREPESPLDCSRPCWSDVSNEHGISSPPIFPSSSNPHALTNESITILEDDSVAEPEVQAAAQKLRYRVQSGNVLLQTQVTDSMLFDMLAHRISEDSAAPLAKSASVVVPEQIVAGERHCSTIVCGETQNLAMAGDLVDVDVVETEMDAEKEKENVNSTNLEKVRPASELSCAGGGDKRKLAVEAACETDRILKEHKITQTTLLDPKMFEKMKSELTHQCKTIGEYEREKKRAARKFQAEHHELERCRAETVKVQKALKDEIEGLRLELAHSQKAISAINAELTKEKERSAQLLSSNKLMQLETARIGQELAASRSVSEQQRQSLEHDIVGLRGTLQDSIDECQKTIAIVGQQKTQLDQFSVQVKTLSAGNSRLEEELKAKQAEVDALRLPKPQGLDVSVDSDHSDSFLSPSHVLMNERAAIVPPPDDPPAARPLSSELKRRLAHHISQQVFTGREKVYPQASIHRPSTRRSGKE